MKLTQKARQAVIIGGLCSISYLAVYIARNILSAVTPEMLENGSVTEALIGEMSSLYFMAYAIGQLINGIIGDKISAKYMISLGLFFAGVTTFVFPYLIDDRLGVMLVYGMTGFFLSMIYGPMTKLVSENTEPIYATRCSIGYTFASFFGSPLAGVLAALLAWQSVFYAGGALLLLMAIACFVAFFLLERRGIIKNGQYVPKEKGIGNIKQLFKYQIVAFSFVSILTGVIRTSVVFWLPTYFAQHLGFSSQESAGLFTGATLLISLTTFIAVFIYEKLDYNMNKTVLLMFVASTAFFALTYFVSFSYLNILFLVLAIMASDGASAMLWSRYCPSLRDTGMVSSVTGYLDFLSYMAAAAANLIFPGAVAAIGWGNLILVWLAIAGAGIFTILPYKKLFSKKKNA